MTKEAFGHAELAEAVAIYTERRAVRFQDIDAAGIVFYPRVLEYFSDAYLGYLASRDFSIARLLETASYGLPLAHAEADFHRPLRFDDALDVSVTGVKVGQKSFRVGYRAVRAHGGELAAVGQTVHVCIDRLSFASTAIPADLLRVFER